MTWSIYAEMQAQLAESPPAGRMLAIYFGIQLPSRTAAAEVDPEDAGEWMPPELGEAA